MKAIRPVAGHLFSFRPSYDELRKQEGGGVSKEITGSVLTTSMTSRFASVIFKMADKVVVEEAVKNIKFYRKIPICDVTLVS